MKSNGMASHVWAGRQGLAPDLSCEVLDCHNSHTCSNHTHSNRQFGAFNKYREKSENQQLSYQCVDVRIYTKQNALNTAGMHSDN